MLRFLPNNKFEMNEYMLNNSVSDLNRYKYNHEEAILIFFDTLPERFTGYPF